MYIIIGNTEGAPSNFVELFDIINAVEDCAWLHRFNVRHRLFDNVRHAAQVTLAALLHGHRHRLNWSNGERSFLTLHESLCRLNLLRPAFALCSRQNSSGWNAHVASDLAQGDAGRVGGFDLLPTLGGNSVRIVSGNFARSCSNEQLRCLREKTSAKLSPTRLVVQMCEFVLA
jgi:hypothetical protein